MSDATTLRPGLIIYFRGANAVHTITSTDEDLTRFETLKAPMPTDILLAGLKAGHFFAQPAVDGPVCSYAVAAASAPSRDLGARS